MQLGAFEGQTSYVANANSHSHRNHGAEIAVKCGPFYVKRRLLQRSVEAASKQISVEFCGGLLVTFRIWATCVLENKDTKKKTENPQLNPK